MQAIKMDMSKPCNPISDLLNPFCSSTQLLKPIRSINSRRLGLQIYSGHRNKPPTISSQDEIPQHPSKRARDQLKSSRQPRHLITISTSSGRWPGQWSCEYAFTLRQLQLADLAQDEDKDAEVFVTLRIQKHAGFGFSIVGRINTCFNRRCSCCSSTYRKEMDTTFDVWVLPSSQSSPSDLPEIGGNDPSVIYVKPGSEADLDSLVKDTIRLTASAKDTCSESCEKSHIIWQYTDGKKGYDRRWSKLLELKNVL